MKVGYFVGVLALAAGAQLAAAQSDSFFFSQSSFTFSLDPDVTASLNGAISGPYQNFTTQATGDGINPVDMYTQFTSLNGAGAINGGTNQAGSESTAFVSGMATQFQGINYYFDFTNNSATQTENVSWTELVNEVLTASGNAQTYAYGGWEVDSYTSYGYFTNGLDGNGNTSPSYVNFTGSQIGPNTYAGTSSFTLSLAPGQTSEVQFWASGSTYAAAPTPEPASFLVLGGLGIFLRKRAKRSS